MPRPQVPQLQIERVEPSASPALFRALGELHVAAIHEGILEALGARFVGTLYRLLSKDPGVSLYVARCEGMLVGFLAGSRNVSRSLRTIGLLGFVRLGFCAAPRLCRPLLLKQIIAAAGYFGKSTTAAQDQPITNDSTKDRSELLAIAVAENAQGKGIGKSLVHAFEEDLQKAGHVGRYFVSTNSTEIGSNAFYRSTGFELFGQKPHHRLLCNVYAKTIGAACA
jgi:ribosomal protein S18 acetylase RimI-like enzyme